jgi:hypothetical protein
MKSMKIFSTKLLSIIFALSFNVQGDCTTTNRLKQIILMEKSSQKVYLNAGLWWEDVFLTSAYKAPRGAKYIYIPPQTTNGVEILRIRYIVEGRDITITHTEDLFYFVIEKDKKKKGPQPFQKERMKKFLLEIFQYGDQLELKVTHSEKECAQGRVLVSKEHSKKEPWFKSLSMELGSWENYVHLEAKISIL